MIITENDREYMRLLGELQDSSALSPSRVMELVSAIVKLYPSTIKHAKRRAMIVLCETNNKIKAIKEYRACTGCGLKESKEVVDGFVSMLGD